jgi:hypothetical protein
MHERRSYIAALQDGGIMPKFFCNKPQFFCGLILLG